MSDYEFDTRLGDLTWMDGPWPKGWTKGDAVHVTITNVEPEPDPLRCPKCGSTEVEAITGHIGSYAGKHWNWCRECDYDGIGSELYDTREDADLSWKAQTEVKKRYAELFNEAAARELLELPPE